MTQILNDAIKAWPAFLTLALVLLPSVITGLTAYPRTKFWLSTLLDFLSVLAHKDSPGTLKPPLTLCKPPPIVGIQLATPQGPANKGFVRWPFWLLLLLLARPAHAQIFSAGASLPMLEVQSDKLHPVVFAPGLGVDAAVGLFQFEALGKGWDALDLSVQLFGNAPGALQAALIVGTLNNLIGIGVAVPLLVTDGSGALQGSFTVYPVLSLSIPIAFGPFSPPTGIDQGARGLVRGGTVYFGAP